MSRLPVDTLVCDTTQIAAWRQDDAFNYNREMVSTQDSLTEWLVARFFELLAKLFGSETAEMITKPLLVLLGAAVVAIIVWFVYKQRPELFTRRRKSAVGYSSTEETIYGVDFDKEIASATATGNWRDAVRYVYLKTLRCLSDYHRIDWQPSKTPSQYVYEERLPAFRQLTTHFLRVRYGNFEATEALYEETQSLSASICQEVKWGAAAHSEDAKGGEA